MCPLIADAPTEPEPVEDEALVLSGDDLEADVAALASRVGSEEQARAMLMAPGSPYHENPTQEQEREQREQLAAMEREEHARDEVADELADARADIIDAETHE